MPFECLSRLIQDPLIWSEDEEPQPVFQADDLELHFGGDAAPPCLAKDIGHCVHGIGGRRTELVQC